MVLRAAWLPARGTIYVGESPEPFNPTIAELSHAKMSPAEAGAEAERNKPKEETGEEAEATESPAKQSRPQPRGPSDLIEMVGEPLTQMLNISSLCSTAKVFHKEGEGWNARGDPTECAIQTFAHRFDWGRERFTEGDSPEWSELSRSRFMPSPSLLPPLFCTWAICSSWIVLTLPFSFPCRAPVRVPLRQ